MRIVEPQIKIQDDLVGANNYSPLPGDLGEQHTHRLQRVMAAKYATPKQFLRAVEIVAGVQSVRVGVIQELPLQGIPR